MILMAMIKYLVNESIINNQKTFTKWDSIEFIDYLNIKQNEIYGEMILRFNLQNYR